MLFDLIKNPKFRLQILKNLESRSSYNVTLIKFNFLNYLNQNSVVLLFCSYLKKPKLYFIKYTYKYQDLGTMILILSLSNLQFNLPYHLFK